MRGMDDLVRWRYVPTFIVGFVVAGHGVRGSGPFVISFFAVAHADRLVVCAIIFYPGSMLGYWAIN